MNQKELLACNRFGLVELSKECKLIYPNLYQLLKNEDLLIFKNMNRTSTHYLLEVDIKDTEDNYKSIRKPIERLLNLFLGLGLLIEVEGAVKSYTIPEYTPSLLSIANRKACIFYEYQISDHYYVA